MSQVGLHCLDLSRDLQHLSVKVRNFISTWPRRVCRKTQSILGLQMPFDCTYDSTWIAPFTKEFEIKLQCWAACIRQYRKQTGLGVAIVPESMQRMTSAM